MTGSDFDFGPASVARAYDDVLVPLMFEPWAELLISERKDWEGRSILDLATGTGVVAKAVSELVGPAGRLVATDLNAEMLGRARERCARSVPPVEFVESPASPLPIPSESIDIAVCQQGFQFFPDCGAAAQELNRVLRPGGGVLISTWLPVTECVFYGWICEALQEIAEPEIEAMIRRPFDYLTADDLTEAFSGAGFAEVTVSRRAADFVIPGGASQAVDVAYATPIGPSLLTLSEEKQKAFATALVDRVNRFSHDGVTMGKLVSNVLNGSKPG